MVPPLLMPAWYAPTSTVCIEYFDPNGCEAPTEVELQPQPLRDTYSPVRTEVSSGDYYKQHTKRFMGEQRLTRALLDRHTRQ
jgi:hypothetical protein